MKRFFLSYGFTFLLFSLFQQIQAQSFEGIISLSITDSDLSEKSEIVWKTKGNMHLLRYTGNKQGVAYNYSMILNSSDSRVKILTEINGQNLAYDADIPTNQESTRYYKHEFSGNRKMIAGFEAEELIVSGSDKKTVCFVAKASPININQLPLVFRNNPVIQYFVANNIIALPLEIITYSNEGKEVFRQVIHSISNEKISDGEFSDKGYKNFSEVLQTD